MHRRPDQVLLQRLELPAGDGAGKLELHRFRHLRNTPGMRGGNGEFTKGKPGEVIGRQLEIGVHLARLRRDANCLDF